MKVKSIKVKFAGVGAEYLHVDHFGPAIRLGEQRRAWKEYREFGNDALVSTVPQGRLDCALCSKPVFFLADGQIVMFPWVLGDFTVTVKPLTWPQPFPPFGDEDPPNIETTAMCNTCRKRVQRAAVDLFNYGRVLS